MNPIDQIITENAIEHESDKCLVRAVDNALGNIDIPKADILASSGLTMKADLQLVSALIDTVRVHPQARGAAVTLPHVSPVQVAQAAPVPVPAIKNRVLAISLAATVLALTGATAYYYRALEESKANTVRIETLFSLKEAERLKSEQSLQEITKTATAAIVSTGASVNEFKSATGDFLIKSEAMAKEIAALRAENAALKAAAVPPPAAK